MLKREDIRANRRKNKRSQQTVAIIIIALGALLIAGVLIIPSLRPAVKTNPRYMAQNNSMGDPNAPVKVEEFSDFQCPYCRIFTEQYEPQIVKDYVETGKVYFTYIPMSFIGQESVRAAEGAFCALDQGKFWEYHDLLFANQNGENAGYFSDGKLMQFARDLRLDTGAFNTCFTSNQNLQKVKDATDYANSKGIDSTPSFIVNGKQVYMDKLAETIEAALKQ